MDEKVRFDGCFVRESSELFMECNFSHLKASDKMLAVIESPEMTSGKWLKINYRRKVPE